MANNPEFIEQNFNQRFGITLKDDEIKKQFVNRIEALLFEKEWPGFPYRTYSYDDVAIFILTDMGENLQAHKSQVTNRFYPLRIITGGKFLRTCQVAEALFNLFSQINQELARDVDNKIRLALSLSTPQLGIRWTSGKFYPSSLSEIDAELIDTTLLWMVAYPAARADLVAALNCLRENRIPEVLGNAYKALENLAQEVTGMKGKALHRTDIQKRLFLELNMSKKWENFLESFIDYANDTRHGSQENRHELPPDEVESHFYLSLVIIHAILKKIKDHHKLG